MKEITLHQFLTHFTMDIRDDKRYCFILGAGASKPSGIRTGGELVKVWMDELHEIYKDDKDKLNAWKKEKEIADDDLASHYSNIFEKRYELNKEDGYAFLEQEMEGREPSCGYSVLAQIVSQHPHNIIITTNFDSLSEDALFIYTQKKPLVIGHSSLAGYIKPGGKRPVIVKIHNDLFLSPKNTIKETEVMEDGLRDSLTDIFKYYIPIVIGYGGNDGSLMGVLNTLAEKNNIKGGMFWFHRENGDNPKEDIIDLIKKFKGCLVKMDGFDEMMIGLGDKLKLDRLDGEITQIAENRARNYREQIEKVMGKESTPKETKDAINEMVARKGKDWWSHELLARSENDLRKRDSIYKEGLKEFKESPELIGSYAHFLHFIVKDKDYDKIESYYKQSIALGPNNAVSYSNYAVFLNVIRKEYDKAEEYYNKAIELDPNNTINLGNYAQFLLTIRKDYDKAEGYFNKAIELDPNNVTLLSNYMLFLKNVSKDYDKAKEYYQKAIKLDPTNTNMLVSYAIFLSDMCKNYDEAEKYYKKALKIDSLNTSILTSYATFLYNHRKDYNKAEEYYQKVIELDPKNINILASYAIFLSDIRKDYAEAEKYFKNNIELEPTNPNHLGNYAKFLIERGDNRNAEISITKAFNSNQENELKELSLELWFYRYAIFYKEFPESADKISALLIEGVQSIGWNLDTILEIAKKNNHSEYDRLSDFAQRITTQQ